MANNKSLSEAKAKRYNEFYTLYSDIEEEMNAYYEYDHDVFRGKTILLPCDDHEWSNFTKYFAANFERFGLKKLISTSYAYSSGSKEITIFEMMSPAYDEKKAATRGKLYVLEKDTDDSGRIDGDDIEFVGYLEGDGDFGSEEVTRLRDEADIVITNPPFAEWRRFLKWIMDAGKQFIILGDMNAITYKDVFPLLKDNKAWLGYRSMNKDMYFNITDEYKKWVVENKKEGSAYKIIDGVVMGRLASACWFTNIDNGKRHEKLVLDTMAHNLKYNKRLRNKLLKSYGDDTSYPHYDNYDAIEVPFIECIPSDYDGAIGTPVSFLGKFNPAQFEILDARDFALGERQRNKNTMLIKDADTVIGDKRPYARVLIRHKKGGNAR